jgi:N-carbamoyl-L-amino-acid hydrolase
MAKGADFVDAKIARHVNGERLWDRLMALAQFGATDQGGVDRQALSGAEVSARAQLMRGGEAVGLAPSTDQIANLFLAYEGSGSSLPPVLVGSHLDSQPTGGKFDGAFGVFAGLECVEAIAASGLRPRRNIELVSWTNEEGSRFAPGMMGSAVFSGSRKFEDILDIKDHAGISVRSELNKVLSAESHLPQRSVAARRAAFLEAHIEQGPILQNEDKAIGVVTGIQGKRTFRVQIDGDESHAGTSPRNSRRDALASAIHVAHALQHALWDREDIVRFTIGMFNVSPNVPSVVPARVVFSIDLRHPDPVTLQMLGDSIPGICKSAAGPCNVSVKELLHDPPLEFPVLIR